MLTPIHQLKYLAKEELVKQVEDYIKDAMRYGQTSIRWGFHDNAFKELIPSLEREGYVVEVKSSEIQHLFENPTVETWYEISWNRYASQPTKDPELHADGAK